MARVGILVDDGFEDSELRVPRDQLRRAGHKVTLIGVEAGKEVRGKKEERVTIEKAAHEVQPEDLDVLVIPGGYSPDHLRMDLASVVLVRGMNDSEKPIAAVCHGPSLLVEADIVDSLTGKRVAAVVESDVVHDIDAGRSNDPFYDARLVFRHWAGRLNLWLDNPDGLATQPPTDR